MKADDARRLLREAEHKEELERIERETKDRIHEDELVRRAPLEAQEFFDGYVTSKVKEAVGMRRREVSVDVRPPATRSGHAWNAALHETLVSNGFAASPPRYVKSEWSDNDFGTVDTSYWSITVSW